jgi:hypothetical protein
MSLGSWKDKLKEAKDEKMSSVQDAVASAKEKASSITPNMDTVKEKLGDTLTELNAIKPILKDNGFKVADVELEISIPPSVNIILDCDGNNVEGLEAAVQEFGELTKIQTAVVNTIKKVVGFKDVVSQSGHKIAEIEIGVSIPPSIVVHLPPVE